MSLIKRYVYTIIAIITLTLGIIGVFLPLLPTTPFLLITLWSASKSSPKLENWLLTHKRFGPTLQAWRHRQAIPLFGKWLACSMMTLSWFILFFKPSSPILLTFLAILFSAVAVYILSRPTA